ncbi:hypothetical protein NDU88_005450 [Pleurodeles waltl]|uniref:Uncharacterized protein n=1 Tax=Pleurodeles waltl TaxID=8319 RepID=A0AAV7NQM1_PLEWA|nr:hypothetical protein NDU88_005450 [Pleurodeles waltl]
MESRAAVLDDLQARDIEHTGRHSGHDSTQLPFSWMPIVTPWPPPLPPLHKPLSWYLSLDVLYVYCWDSMSIVIHCDARAEQDLSCKKGLSEPSEKKMIDNL